MDTHGYVQRQVTVRTVLQVDHDCSKTPKPTRGLWSTAMLHALGGVRLQGLLRSFHLGFAMISRTRKAHPHI